MSLAQCQLVCLKPDDGTDAIAFCPDSSKNSITIGSDPNCEIRIRHDDVKSQHFRIYADAAGKIKIMNLCKERCILVNDETVEGKKFLRSGDIISCVGNRMRWQSKAEAKRLTLLMTKSERKAKASSGLLKTSKRITVHKFNSQIKELQQSQSETEVALAAPELKKEGPEPLSPPPAVPNKENEASPKSNLNLSGILRTTYTPKVSSAQRSSLRVSKTPKKFNTSSNQTPCKSVLSETATNLVDAESPSQRIRGTSMYLIDLTPSRGASKITSTPMTTKRSTVKNTPSRRADNVLLKSAIKNSTLKKNVEELTTNPKVNRRTLSFNENDGSALEDFSVMDPSTLVETEVEGISKELSEPSTSSALIENVSNLSGVENLKSPSCSDRNREFDNLIGKIEDINDDEDVGFNNLCANDSGKGDDTNKIEENFNKILESSDRRPSSQADSGKIDCDESNSLSIDKQFDNLIGKPSISRTYSPAVKTHHAENDKDELSRKKAEQLFNWMDDVKNSLAKESNPTEQVLSERYSNVTPNDSIAEKIQPRVQEPEGYDPKIRKVSILEAVSHLNKTSAEGHKLTKSPTSRLSLSNGTHVLENYQVLEPNSEMPKSLRSSRKQFGKAMASLNNFDEPIDSNETLNDTTNETNQNDLNQSKDGDPNYLSLDKPSQSVDQEQKLSNNYIQFEKATEEYDGSSVQEIFEFSNRDNSQNEEEEKSDGEDEMTSDSGDDDDFSGEELVLTDDSIPPQFRIDENELEEGVKPLDDLLNEKTETAKEETINLSIKAESTAYTIEDTFLEFTESQNEMSEIIPPLNNEDEISADVTNSTFGVETIESSQEVEESKTIDDEVEIPATQMEDLYSLTGSIESSHDTSFIDEQLEEELLNPKETDSAECETSFRNTQNEAVTPQVNEGLNVQEQCSVEEDIKIQDFSQKQNVECEPSQANIPDKSEELTSSQGHDIDTSKTIQSDDEDNEKEISTSQTFAEEESVPVEAFNKNDFEVPTTQNNDDLTPAENQKTQVKDSTVGDESTVYEAASDVDTTLLTPSTSGKKTFFESRSTMPAEESLLFSDTEFSRVEIEQALMTDSSDSPNIHEEIKGLSEMPGTSSNKRGATMLPDQITQSSKSRVTLAAAVVVQEESLSNSFKQYVELQQELVNVQDKLNLGPRARSLTPERDIKPIDSRKTMAPPSSDLSETFEQYVEQQQELVNVQDQPNLEKRARSVTPVKTADQEKKSVIPRKTIVPSTAELSESFEQYVELQKELVNVEGHSNSEIRARSLTPKPKRDNKPIDSRKTMAPLSDDLSESFEQYVHLQKELVNVQDQPNLETRARSVTPVKTTDQEKKSVIPRKTIVPSTAELSESFEQYVELQKELVNVEGHSNSEIRARSLTPKRDNKPIDSRKTMAPLSGDLSESFEQYVHLQKELVNVQDQPNLETRARSVTPVKNTDQEKKSVIPRKTIVTSTAELSESFEELIKSQEKRVAVEETEQEEMITNEPAEKIDEIIPASETTIEEIKKVIEEAEDQQEVVEEPCVKKVAYVTTPAKKIVEESIETPSRRRAARVNYCDLASGSTQWISETPKSHITPRRGRSASIDSVVSTENVEIKVKSSRKAKPPVTCILEEAEIVTTKVPETELKQYQQITTIDNNEKKIIETSLEASSTVAIDLGTRRRGQRVNYAQLATGTPGKESVQTKRTRKNETKSTLETAVLTQLEVHNYIEEPTTANPIEATMMSRKVKVNQPVPSSGDDPEVNADEISNDDVQQTSPQSRQKRKARKVVEVISISSENESEKLQPDDRKKKKAETPRPEKISASLPPKRGRREPAASSSKPEETTPVPPKRDLPEPEASSSKTKETTPAPPKRGRREPAALSSKPEETTTPAPPKRGRREPEALPSKPEDTTTSALLKRGRREPAAVSSEPEETTTLAPPKRGRREPKASPSKPEDSTTPAPPKRGRREPEALPSKPEDTTTPAPLKRGRREPAAVSSEPEKTTTLAPPKRGRREPKASPSKPEDSTTPAPPKRGRREPEALPSKPEDTTTPAPLKRGRREPAAVSSEPEKTTTLAPPKRGRREPKASPSKPEDSTTPAPPKRGRREPEALPSKPEDTTTSALLKRGRREPAAVSSEPEETTTLAPPKRGRREPKASPSKPEDSTTPAPPKRGRREPEALPSKPEDTTTPAPLKRGRREPAAVSSEPEKTTTLAPPKRGRREPKASPSKPEDSTTPAPPKRGRREPAAVSSEPKETTTAAPPKRGRRDPSAVSETNSAKSQPEKAVQIEMYKTSRRGNKKNEELASQTRETSRTPLRGRAASKASEVNAPVQSYSQRSLRSQSRNKSPEVLVEKSARNLRAKSKASSPERTLTANNLVDVQLQTNEQAQKPPRKRKANKPTAEPEAPVETEPSKSRPGKGRKLESEEITQTEKNTRGKKPSTVQISETEPEIQNTRLGKTKKTEDNETQKSQPASKSRKAKKEEQDVESQKFIEPELKKSRRGNKKETETEKVSKPDPEPIAAAPKSRRGNMKQEVENDDEPVKTTRGRRGPKKDESKEVIEPVATKTQGKQTKVEEVAPIKRGRGKAAASVEVATTSERIVIQEKQPEKVTRVTRSRK